MGYALFLGCNIPARVQGYEASARVLLRRLGVEVSDLPQFGCCGYPLRGTDPEAALLLAARNLALAEGKGLDVLALCQCCYGTLRKVQERLEEDRAAKGRIEEVLGREGLSYLGRVRVRHLLDLLWRDMEGRLREALTDGLGGTKVSAHYGCHALRPSSLMALDDPSDPKVMEELVRAAGGEAVWWSKRLDCCGAPLLGFEDDLSLEVMKGKVEDCLRAGAEVLCVACPYCYLQFQRGQQRAFGRQAIPVVLITQLLGLAANVPPKDLGLGEDLSLRLRP